MRTSGAPQGVLVDPSSLTVVLEVDGEVHGVIGDKFLIKQDDGFVLLDTGIGSKN